ncbi:response regulator transcription factor [Planctobacterium marinum]|uniref:DNA-binding response regulator n=1 Tax=Planctobacterium marinum TaxID=1631968 RepID=A0AA48HTA5_9ALTE|nr:DNA-binding response regulator [Planctobacterium marinum]
MNILLADDEQPLLNFLLRGLRAEGFECNAVNELHEVLPAVRKNKPQLLILDRMFHDEDSLNVVEPIKQLPSAPLILMLTALDEVSERVKGLHGGADDYLCKPFDFDELLARITALSRRANKATEQDAKLLSIASLQINTEQRLASLDGKELSLTKIEYELLLYLVENDSKVLSRERILSRVWQTQSDPHTNIVDVYISRLRKKLETEKRLSIQTLRGNGYRLSLDKDE